MFTRVCSTISWPRCLLAALLSLLCAASAAFANPVASSTMAASDSSRSATAKSEWLICSKSDSSLRSNCSIATEKMLLERSTDDLESIFYDFIRPHEELYRDSYESVIKNATAIIEGAEKDAPWVLRNVYDDNRLVFDRLYMGLVWYTRTTMPLMRGQMHQKREFSVSPARSLRQLLRSFTAELAEQLIQSRTPHLSYRLSASQLRCLASALRSSNDSSESQAGERIANLLDESLFAPLEKPLIVIRVWLNVYLAVAKFTKDVLSQRPITEECVRAFGAVKTCDRCASITASQPCRNTCELVAQTCLSLSNNFSDNWQQFIETASLYSRENNVTVSLSLLPGLLSQFTHNLLSAASSVASIDFSNLLNASLTDGCLYDRDDYSDETLDESWTAVSSGISAGSSRQQLEEAISSNWLMNNTAYMFLNLENAIISALCQRSADELDCWSGVAQLRTSPRSIRAGQLAFDSAVNFTQRQAESVEHTRQFYHDYAMLFRDYTGQIRTGGTLPAGHTLLRTANVTVAERPCASDSLSCTSGSGYDSFDDEFGDDEEDASGSPYSDDDELSNIDGSADSLDGSADSQDAVIAFSSSSTSSTSTSSSSSTTTVLISTTSSDVARRSNQNQNQNANDVAQLPNDLAQQPKQDVRLSTATSIRCSSCCYLLTLLVFYATFAVLFHPAQ